MVAPDRLTAREQAMQSQLEELRLAKERLEAQQHLLEEANRRLQELSVAKDEFVANMSHELRTPLTVVKEGVSLLVDGSLGSLNDEQRNFLTTVDESADRLAALIENLLDFSKLEAGRLRLVRRRVDMRDLVEATIRRYALLAGRRTIRTILPPAPPVYADADRIQQVLSNLFNNAIKFTRDDGTITFSLEIHEPMVSTVVRDDGAGIAQEDLGKLFQKFSQVGAGTTKPKGTGLGLALCRQLVQLHQGEILVVSEPGKGTAFSFTIPIYTQRFALEDEFRTVMESARRRQAEAIGLIAIDAVPFRDGAVEPGQQLSQTADMIRGHVRGDVVFSYEPRWVIVMAMADAKGIQAVVQRLEKLLTDRLVARGRSQPGVLMIRSAMYPTDAMDVYGLFAKATGERAA